MVLEGFRVQGVTRRHLEALELKSGDGEHRLDILGCLHDINIDIDGMDRLRELVYFRDCKLPTQGMRSIISMVSVSPESFMPSILLLVVVIVTVVIVTVILVVFVVAIDGVVIVVTIIGSSGGVMDLIGDEDPTDEDRDIGVDDSEVLVSLGEISSGGRKCQESNIGDSDNTEDGGK
nr:hypothetical protein [Tanacetum cinerariifolium]